jgi:alkaline phosphatase
MRQSLVCLVLAAVLAGSASGKPRRAKNVILLLADAGGIPTLNAASIVGHNAPLKLFVQSWPHVGLSDTSPVGSWVSDSAAGMTAIVTGQKTHNGVISMGPDTVRGKKDGTRLKTILEYAEERGLSTGVISNVTIADATPAACYSQANDRRKLDEIFLQIFSPRFGDGVDFVLGPGRKRIYGVAAANGRDIDAAAARAGRPVLKSLAELPAEARRGLVVADEGFDLEAAVKRALGSLSKNRKGFFLMIESDAHTDNPEAGLGRLIAFDKLIREISTLVNRDETLLVFTADHSFDLRVPAGKPEEPLLKGFDEWKRTKGKGPVHLPYIKVDGSHTAEEVVVAATGPGAERVRGFLPNTEIFRIMMEAYGWRPEAGRAK